MVPAAPLLQHAGDSAGDGAEKTLPFGAGEDSPFPKHSGDPRQRLAKQAQRDPADDSDLFEMQIDTFNPEDEQAPPVEQPDQAMPAEEEGAEEMPSKAELQDMAEVDGLPIEQCVPSCTPNSDMHACAKKPPQ